MTVNVPMRGRYRAVKAQSLRLGMAIMRPNGRARIESVTVGDKVVWLRLTGLDIPYTVNIWKRKESLVGVADE